MLVIDIKTKGESYYQFTWRGNAEESRSLYEQIEDAAAREGHDAKDMAAQVIAASASIKIKSKVEERRLLIWVVYAVFRYAMDDIDFAKYDDQTIFDLAEHQRITTKHLKTSSCLVSSIRCSELAQDRGC